MDETGVPWPGLSLSEQLLEVDDVHQHTMRISTMGYFILKRSANKTDLNGRYKVVIVHPYGVNGIYVYYNGTFLGYNDQTVPYPILSKTLLIGAYRSGNTDDGSIGRYYKGTVYKAEIWDYAMNTDEALAWA